MVRSYLLLTMIASLSGIPSTIDIRKATNHDLSALLAFDTSVSYEYFLPLYASGYAHLPLGNNPQYYLDHELEEDRKWFPTCIQQNDCTFLLAYDKDTDGIAGFIIGHKESHTTIEIDLLLIHQEYRKKGIGRALIQAFTDSFPDASVCIVYPLRFANKDTLSFYQSVGFVNEGIPTTNRVNSYGISYQEMYYFFTYRIPR